MNTATAYRVLIADDELICLDGLELVLSNRSSVELCGRAQGGRELVQLATELQPDVIITDIRMPDMDGIEATRQIKKEWPWIKILGLTQYSQEYLVAAMLGAGADGYLLKNVESDTLVEAIGAVVSGAGYFCKKSAPILQELLKNEQVRQQRYGTKVHFSPKEKEVLEHMSRGLAIKQIAEKMGIGFYTVAKYRQNMYHKAGLENEVALVVYAIVHRIIIP